MHLHRALDALAFDGFDPAESLQITMGGAAEQQTAESKKAADVFSAAVLIFWTLTLGRNPFGDEPSQRTAAILRGEPSALPLLARLPEAQHLIGLMLGATPAARLSAAQARRHPALWSDEERLLFVRCVSDDPALSDDRSDFVRALEAQAPTLFAGGDWTTAVHAELLATLQGHRSYHGDCVRDLLRAVRNCDHLQGMPDDVQQLLLPRPAGIAAYFLPRYPALFWALYKLVTRYWRAHAVFAPFFSWQAR